MTNTAFHRVAHLATPRMAPGAPLRIAAQTLAVIARMQALRQAGGVIGAATLPAAARRTAADRAAMPAMARHLGGISARNGTADAGERLTRHFAPVKASPAGRLTGAQAVRALPAGSRHAAVAALIAIPRLAHGAGQASPSELTVKSAPSLMASIDGFSRHSRRLAAIAAPGAAARVRQRVAAPASPLVAAPGFHRTVRQPEAKTAAGNVYLDKTLVEYHLAAAITTEQTRSAARPNGSGASFNSSMAALRPTGAGL